MGHGERVGGDGHFWPKRDETPEGEELRGKFIGPRTTSYEGKPRQAAAFQVGEEVVLITATGFVEYRMPELVKDQSYYVKFVCMVKTNSGQKAFSFEVFNDDGQA